MRDTKSGEDEERLINVKDLFNHIKKYVIRGLLAIIPLGLTFLVIRFLYVTIDKRVMGAVHRLIGFSIPGLGILLLLIILYLLGHGASNVMGKQIFSWIETITDRIPLIKTTYKIGKQLQTTLSLPEQQIFERAVLVEYFRPGMWTIGFVTGTLTNRENPDEVFLKVFVPTSPNPTTGLIIVVREAQTKNPRWSIEDAMKAVVSGGILGPAEIN